MFKPFQPSISQLSETVFHSHPYLLDPQTCIMHLTSSLSSWVRQGKSSILLAEKRPILESKQLFIDRRDKDFYNSPCFLEADDSIKVRMNVVIESLMHADLENLF